MNDIIFNEDCILTLSRPNLEYDYVFTCPPDFAELGLDDPILRYEDYGNFLYGIFKDLNPKNGSVTVAITDRKFKNQIITKHALVIKLFRDLDYHLQSHKIWMKTDKVDFIRMGYAHVMTFSKTGVDDKPSMLINNDIKDFKPDIWNDGKGPTIDGFRNAMPLATIERCILKYTNENQTVYDPFMGTGSTAIACINNSRHYVGSEICKNTFEICEKRLSQLTAKIPGL